MIPHAASHSADADSHGRSQLLSTLSTQDLQTKSFYCHKRRGRRSAKLRRDTDAQWSTDPREAGKLTPRSPSRKTQQSDARNEASPHAVPNTRQGPRRARVEHVSVPFRVHVTAATNALSRERGARPQAVPSKSKRKHEAKESTAVCTSDGERAN